MRIINRNVAGLDVHKKSVVAAISVLDGEGTRYQAKGTFETMTNAVLAMADW